MLHEYPTTPRGQSRCDGLRRYRPGPCPAKEDHHRGDAPTWTIAVLLDQTNVPDLVPDERHTRIEEVGQYKEPRGPWLQSFTSAGLIVSTYTTSELTCSEGQSG